MQPARLIRRAALAGAFAIGLTSCGDPTAPASEPSLRGTVTSVLGGLQMSVLVEELELPAADYDAIELVIRGPGEAARVFVREADGSLRRGSEADLDAGAKILAWTTGIERRSLPPQWDATTVVVLADGSRR